MDTESMLSATSDHDNAVAPLCGCDEVSPWGSPRLQKHCALDSQRLLSLSLSLSLSLAINEASTVDEATTSGREDR
jgi:hypothetical protein